MTYCEACDGCDIECVTEHEREGCIDYENSIREAEEIEMSIDIARDYD